MGDRLADRLRGARLGHPRGVDQLGRHRPSRRGGQAHDREGVPGQRPAAGEHDLPQALRQPPDAVARAGREQLLGIERVAVGLGEHLVGQRGGGRLAEDPGQDGGALLARERQEPMARHGLAAQQLGDELPQRRARGVPVAIGHDERQPLVLHVTCHIRDQVPRAAVGPVEVLDDEQHRPRARQPAQQAQQQLVQAPGRVRRIRGRGVGATRDEIGQDPRQLLAGARGQPSGRIGGDRARDLAQRRRDREVGALALLELHAVAPEHREAGGVGALHELGDEARLADPRLAGDQRDRGDAAGGVVAGRLQRGQLPGSADEVRARDPPRHGTEYPRGRVHIGRG